MKTSHRLVVGLLTVAGLTLAAGCLNDDEPPREPALLEPSLGKDANTGSLTIRFQYPQRTAVYAEGARHYLQVSTADRAVVVRRDEGTEQGPGAGYTDSMRLAPGDYTVQTFQRGCDFTQGTDCEETFEPAEDWCSTPVTIEPDATVRVTIKLRLPQGCDVAVS